MRRLNVFGSGYGPVAGSCEHGNEPSGSIKGGEINWLSDTSQGLCSMQLI
jgi:hypothetical protein